jgi:Zn finger protein HypA/HybF involved in hydrogenase expression
MHNVKVGMECHDCNETVELESMQITCPYDGDAVISFLQMLHSENDSFFFALQIS